MNKDQLSLFKSLMESLEGNIDRQSENIDREMGALLDTDWGERCYKELCYLCSEIEASKLYFDVLIEILDLEAADKLTDSTTKKFLIDNGEPRWKS